MLKFRTSMIALEMCVQYVAAENNFLKPLESGTFLRRRVKKPFTQPPEKRVFYQPLEKLGFLQPHDYEIYAITNDRLKKYILYECKSGYNLCRHWSHKLLISARLYVEYL
jgi:hypothetical protein